MPYFSRGDIDKPEGKLAGDEIVWVDDAIDLFFLHIQGSGQVELKMASACESAMRTRTGIRSVRSAAR